MLEQVIRVLLDELTFMSGTETLLPYLKERAKNEHPTIVVDTREASSSPKIVKGLKEVYVKPFILIEGYMPIVYKFSKIQPASVWGAMFALAKQGINMIHTNSYKETVDFLYTAAKQEQIMEKRSPVIHPIKLTETLQDQQIFFLASLPNIGREKAISLLNSYQTPMNALLNVDSWKKEAYGLGPIITEKVRQVLNTPYTQKEREQPSR